MTKSNSRKHARKVTLDAAVNNAIEKAVDARKVAAFTVGAAGVLAGAAFAFGATPAMAAETGAATEPTKAPVAAGDKAGAGKKDEAGKKDDGKADAKPEAKETVAKETESNNAEDKDAAKQEQTGDKNQTEANKDAGDKAENTNKQAEQPVAKTEDKKSYEENQKQETTTTVGQDRDASAAPEPKPQANNTINLSKDTKDNLPNMYAWGKSNNVYIEDGQNKSVTINFAKPDDGYTITKVAIFPSDGNTVDNKKSRGFLEYYSDPSAKDEHKPYSGIYDFKVNPDGTATLTMSKLYRDGNLKSGESYSANRCIYLYGTDKDGKTVVLYKTNIVRAATLIPPKTAGSIVLQYDEKLNEDQIQAKLKQALDAPTEATGNKSIREQIKTASTSNGVGVRNEAAKTLTNTPDTAENKVIITDHQAYDPSQVARINKETSQQGQPTTYVTGVNNLKTYLISDLGYKSEPLALTVARYDTRIDKPIVEDPTNLSKEVKEEIAKKLANLNHIAQDKVTINADGTVTINFEGVDPSLAPTLQLSDLVLKQLKEADVNVPTGEKAVFVYNPLDYSKDEIARIKKAIYEANKKNDKLGLSDTDYEKQISLSYLTGNLTASGTGNQGISNGRQENTITVKIKTDKAVAEFTSDVTKSKLTKFVNIREDYTVSWTKDKIDGRNSDEGLSWSEDHKTIIYRYDPTKAVAFKSSDITKLLTATPKAGKAGLRVLKGDEHIDHEGEPGKEKKSHVYYVIDSNGEPTGALTLGIMNSGYWTGDPQITGTEVDRGNVLSKTGEYKWDDDAKPVTLASKDGKIYRARLFVAPYGMESYQYVYTHPDGKNPNNTTKAINVIFVPQTNHKTKDLKTSVEGHKLAADKKTPIDSAYYNASKDKKDAYDEALKEANAALEAAGNTEDSKLSEALKARIDNATINLNKAREALDGAKTDKEKLKASIDENGKAAEGNNPATLTQATNQFKNVSDPDFKDANGNPDTKKNEDAKAAKKAYDEALQAAEAARDDENATQKAVDDAKAKLDEARKKLNDFTTNKDELSAAIAKDGKVNTGEAGKTGDEKLKTADPTYQNSTKEERDAYDKAVAEAQKVVADPNASQKEVNEAIKNLKEAKAALDKNATDKSPLDAAVQKSLDKDPNNHSVFYKNAAAKKDTDPAAKKAVEDYDKALAEAKRVLGDKNATKADVEKAKKDLEDAENALHADAYATDNKSLGEALADNFSGYLMPAYFNAFDKAQAGDEQAKKDFKAYNDAYHAAKDLMDKTKQQGSTVTQDEVDKVKKQLLEARKVIDKYATDTSKISAALLHSLAITNSPAYKNASAGAEGSEEAKAKKAYDDALKALQDAFNDKMPQDTVDGKPDSDPISTDNIPAKDGDTSSPDYLKNIQSHAKGQPLNRDVTKLLAKLNDAVKGLDKFATKTDELIESINKDSYTHPSPAFKNASLPSYKNDDGSDNTDKNNAAKKAVDAYGEALNKAKEKLNDPNATQKDINDAKAALDKARTELDKYNTDVAKLQESVAAHGTEAVEGTKDSDAYRNASDPHFVDETGKPDEYKNQQARDAKTAYDKALTEAQALLAKHNDDKTPQDAKPTQAEIDAALAKLDEARKTLVGDDSALDKPGFGTKTTDLDVELAKSSPVDATDPTPGTVEDLTTYKNALAKTTEDGKENPDITRYKEALKKATKLAEKQKSTKASERPLQKDVDEAYRALLDAKKIIADGYKTDATALQDEAALGADDGNFTKSPEYKNAEAKKAEDGGDNAELKAYKAALTEVKTMLNNFGKDGKPNAGVGDQDLPTQAQVDAALKKLSEARKAVEAKYATNTDKLKNEVGDKDQDGNPVIPPFEASVAYKNALEKAKTEESTTTDPNSATAKLKTYADKLKEANDLINKVKNPDPNAKPEDRPTQDDVDKALAALKQAKKDIDDNFKTNVEKLQNEVDDKNEDGSARTPEFEKSTEFANLEAKTVDGKKPDDLVAYEQALAKAKELIDKNDGEVADPTDPTKKVTVPKDQLPTQQEVDEAKKALKEIKDKILANYKTSPVELQNEVDLSKDGDDDTSTDVFENTPAFKNAQAKGDEAAQKALKDYNEKLKAAKEMLAKFDRTTGKPKKDAKDVPTQKQLDEALKALQDAKKKIEDEYSTSKSDLRQEAGDDFTKSPEYQNAQAKGDDASKKALEDYKNALDEANSVLADPNATQAEVDAALKRLKTAKDKLKDENGTDKSKLQAEADDDANFRNSPYFIIGNKADIEAYEDALAEAKSVLADPNATQAEVDAALKKLEEAKKRILDFLSHFGGSGNGTGDYGFGEGNGFVNGHESYGALVDKSALQIEVNNAVETSANTAEAVAYRQALAEAKSVLNDPNATQAQVDAALRKLQAAKAALLNSLSGASGHKIAKTGAATGLFAGFAAIFAGLGAAGVASRRRKHSNE
ncbi:FIVAR domain-containing protein [Gardnerella greenwoodii]|uniref:EbhA protein n=1 Tax=Gardnerella greenwoodii 00703Dmash TaxID=698960 RepID=I4M871_9BIFI|nr:FIVAR domain-containing protein [Gardnerella greenwoodii]EIK85411.1 ebhA protein [Gardnerella greenwoodii 00703Dmash]